MVLQTQTATCLGIGLAIGILCSASMAAEPSELQLRPERLLWSNVTMKASKFGFSTDSQLDVSRVSSSLETPELLAPEGASALQPQGPELIQMSIRSNALGIHSETRFWFDSSDAQVLQWITIESGKRTRYKASRVLQGAAWVLRKNPTGKAEQSKSHEEWTHVRSVTEELPGWPAGEPMTASAGIFYVVATAPLEKVGDRIEILTPSKGEVYPIEITVDEMVPVKVDFSLTGPDGKRPIKGKRDSLLLSLRPLPPEGVDPREFKLIGLEGDVDLWLDAEYRFPLQIEGKIAYAGKVKIRVKQATLGGSD